MVDNTRVSFYDLASLSKPLVTAPLALAFLDLDMDRRGQLGFSDRREPLTVRQLLSHSAGLPPWLPYTGEPLAAQMRRGWPLGEVPLLRVAEAGRATYSDLGYRLVAELLEQETGIPWKRLGNSFTALSPAPWRRTPPPMPAGPDEEAWLLAAPPERPFPAAEPHLPHDGNARAGMPGHAGFAADAAQLRAWLQRWVQGGWPKRMAIPVAGSVDGAYWGLGLQAALDGPGRFGRLLAKVPPGVGGVHVMVQPRSDLSSPAPGLEGPTGEPGGWWFHTGFTGPLLCVRPADGCCIALLCHRLDPAGRLLDLEQLRSRRWEQLESVVSGLTE
jgi:CubicO group peptidase (beta-lactamase class C family)